MSPVPTELFDSFVALEGNNWNAEILGTIASCKGLILLADGENRPVQLLQSANLRKTALARLLHQDGTKPVRSADLSRLTKLIYYKCCYSDFKTNLELLRISQTLGVETNIETVKLPRTSFAAIDLDAALPYFYVSTNPGIHTHRKAWGLFPSRKSAQNFCQSLNIAFCLCRNPSLLQSQSEESCPYLQMHQCSGPCLERVSRANYMDWVWQAIQAADGNTAVCIEKLTMSMKQAAQEKRFEQAQTLKNRIALLQALQDPSYKWTDNLGQLCILHIDKGPKVQIETQKRKQQKYAAWKITSESIFELGLFGNSEEFNDLFEKQWQNPDASFQHLSQQDHFGLLSLMLFRSRPQGVWINASRQKPESISVFEQVRSMQEEKKEDAEIDSTSSEDVAPRGFEPLSPG